MPHNGFSDDIARDAVLTCVRSYREAMAKFSTMRALDVWYARFEAESLIEDIDDDDIRARTRKSLDKAKNTCVVEDVFPKLADNSGETPTIKDNPPYHLPPPRTRGGRVLRTDRGSLLPLPRIAAGRPAGPPGPICRQGQGDQGGGRRQRRHRLQHRALDGGRKGPALPPGQGSAPARSSRPMRARAYIPTMVNAS